MRNQNSLLQHPLTSPRSPNRRRVGCCGQSGLYSNRIREPPQTVTPPERLPGGVVGGQCLRAREGGVASSPRAGHAASANSASRARAAIRLGTLPPPPPSMILALTKRVMSPDLRGSHCQTNAERSCPGSFPGWTSPTRRAVIERLTCANIAEGDRTRERQPEGSAHVEQPVQKVRGAGDVVLTSSSAIKSPEPNSRLPKLSVKTEPLREKIPPALFWKMGSAKLLT